PHLERSPAVRVLEMCRAVHRLETGVISERVLVKRFDRLRAGCAELRVDVADLRDHLLAALADERTRARLQIGPAVTRGMRRVPFHVELPLRIEDGPGRCPDDRDAGEQAARIAVA